MVWAVFGINHPRDFWKFWNCPRFTRAISKFSKTHLGNLSQIALPNMWLPVLIDGFKLSLKSILPFSLGIFAKFSFWYYANLNKSVNFSSPWKLRFSHDFRRIEVKSCWILQAKFGNDLLFEIRFPICDF